MQYTKIEEFEAQASVLGSSHAVPEVSPFFVKKSPSIMPDFYLKKLFLSVSNTQS